jgi:heme-degrading monooxygenase HmoA
VIALVFSYQAREPTEFERVYGPNGDWSGFFRRGRGYIGTELLRDLDGSGRYLVIDRWESADAYNTFVAEHRDEYMERSDESRLYYEQELHLGTFENVWDEPSAA